MSKRPVLRYHGGKWKLAPWIISHFPEHRVYVEPYGGAASVLMRKPRCYAEIYNDLDGEIVNVFRVLRDPISATELERILRLTPFSRSEFRTAYIPSDEPVERARKSIIKAFMGFGSPAITQAQSGFRPTTGYRTRTGGNGPSCATEWKNFADLVPDFTSRLLDVVIEERPARDLMRFYDGARAGLETLFYLDPPYPHSVRATGHGSTRPGRAKSSAMKRYRHEMTEADHIELLTSARALRGMVVLSGYPCDLYTDMLDGWTVVAKETHADGARDRVECLWINPAAASKNQLTMFQEG